MSNGGVETEAARRERHADEAAIAAWALVRNSVLRRALALAAYDHGRLLAEYRRPDALATADTGVALMIDWVMRAAAEV